MTKAWSFQRIHYLVEIKRCKPFNKQQWAQLMDEDGNDQIDKLQNSNLEVEEGEQATVHRGGFTQEVKF